MSRYLLTFEFDGTHFSGWQKQPDTRTVEGEIEQAFAQLYQKDIDVIGQGRTDAGVHAKAQTAHVDLPDKYSNDKILHAMRGLLPADVALTDIQKVSSDFHARFSALSRSYQYRISLKPSPLKRSTTWYFNLNTDSGVLKKCADLVRGEHNFINFCIPNDEDFGTTQCHIFESRWQVNSEEQLLIYEIEGNRFLRHMVRRLVGSMIQTATGKLTPDEFKELLTGADVARKAHSAPALGLVLKGVRYPGLSS